MVDLRKVIEPGTWRSLGLSVPELHPRKIPVAGISVTAILDAHGAGAQCFVIGASGPDNAFVIAKDRLKYLYVRVGYTGYRRAAMTVFGQARWPVDYDHALAQNIARSADYRYVLLLRIRRTANRAHGAHERKRRIGPAVPPVCFADDRILDKSLGRRPRLMGGRARVLAGYSPEEPTASGLTLKQRGALAFALGLDEGNPPSAHSALLRPFPVRGVMAR